MGLALNYYRLLRLIFGGGLVLMMLIQPEARMMSYELVKVDFFFWWIRALLVLYGIGLFGGWLPGRRIDAALLGAFVALVMSGVLSSGWNGQLGTGLTGSIYRGNGLLLWGHMVLLAQLVSQFWGVIRVVDLVRWIGVGIGAQVLIVGWDVGVDLWYGGSGAWRMVGYGGSFGSPVLLAGFLAVVGVGLVGWGQAVSKTWRYLSWIGMGWLLLFSMAWGSWIALGAGLGILWASRRGVRAILVYLVVLIILIGLGTGWVLQQDIWGHESRARVYRSVWQGAWERPLLGYGWGRVDAAFEAGAWPLSYADDVYVDDGHNLLLGIFAQGGLVGLAAMLLVLWLAGKRLVVRSKGHQEDYWLVVSGMLISFGVLAYHNVYSVVTLAWVWILMGLVLGRKLTF